MSQRSLTEGLTWGLVEQSVLHRLLVISPHLDDAVLSAGELIASYPGSAVVTVFAGRPPRYPAKPTAWDAAGGFGSGDDVVAARRKEDSGALDVLGASAIWLDFVDHQYLGARERPRAADIAPALAEVVKNRRPTAVFMPMGIANPDHVVTHEAGLMVRAGLDGRASAPQWFCYQDAGYSHLPGLLAWRISRLMRSSAWPTPPVIPVRPDPVRKRAAVANYRSQLPPLRAEHGLDERLAANVPEQLWHLAPPPKGWERLAWDL